MCQATQLISTNPTTMELSFVVSIFLAFVIFKVVGTSPKLSQTTHKQCELQPKPNEVSNGSINPCTYEFLLDLSRVHENMKIQSDLLGSMGDVLDEVFTQHLDQSIILTYCSSKLSVFLTWTSGRTSHVSRTF